MNRPCRPPPPQARSRTPPPAPPRAISRRPSPTCGSRPRSRAQKGGQDEGFSIPAQRQANAHKADAIGARIVAEFVDAGESAKSADRPELQRMIAYVKTHRVAYC